MKVAIRQVKSTISAPENQKRNMKALGLGKINRTVELEYTDSVKGMVRKVEHLVEVKEIA
jgi:large subunit ribosomal protein L30